MATDRRRVVGPIACMCRKLLDEFSLRLATCRSTNRLIQVTVFEVNISHYFIHNSIAQLKSSLSYNLIIFFMQQHSIPNYHDIKHF